MSYYTRSKLISITLEINIKLITKLARTYQSPLTNFDTLGVVASPPNTIFASIRFRQNEGVFTTVS